MHEARRILALFAMGPAVLCLFACTGGDDSGTKGNRPLSARNSVAKVNLAGGAFEVRMPGEREFKPWKKENGPYLPRGATVRSGEGLVTFNFLQCVQIQLGAHSVLILQGDVPGRGGREFLLGLEKGEVMVGFQAADYPLVVKMPHGEARGMRGVIKIRNMRWDPKEGYRAVVHALSNNITVSNDRGALTLPSFGDVRLVENEPPAILQERGPGGRRLPRRPGR